MASYLTQHMSPYVMECMRSAMLLTFTNEQLESEYFTERHRYSRRKYHRVSSCCLTPNDVGRTFSDTRYRLETLIQEYCEDGHSPVYLVRLKTLAASIDRAKVKYGDPSVDGYKLAMDSGAEIAVTIQEALSNSSRNTKSEFPLTAAQEEGLSAVMFLLRQTTKNESTPVLFSPTFSPEDTSIDRWMTARVLSAPDDVEGNLAAFRDRVNRSREIGAKLVESHHDMRGYDVLCDYPDELIDQLAQMQRDDYRLWDGLRRYVITVSSMNSQHTVNELLYFMKPYVDQLNVRYLAGTIPSVLRVYECLPPMDDYSKASEPLRAQCAALLRVGIAISTTFYGDARKPFLNNDRTIRDQRLIDLLLSHPERSEEIAAAIEERNIADFDSLVQFSSGALGNGTL